MKFINATTARTTFLNLVDEVKDERVAITKNGQPVAVLLAYNDYRVLRATQALARDPEKLAHVVAMAERVGKGDLDAFPDAAELIARHTPATA